MKLIFKLSFCLMLFVSNNYILSAQVTDALIIDDKGNVNVPNGNVTAAGNVNTTHGKLQENGNALVPRGVIVMWYGSADSIPNGWALCNGQKKDGVQTPNLSGRFIVAAGSNGETTYNRGDSSGVDKPTIKTEQLPSHIHGVNIITGLAGDHRHTIETVNYSTKEERDGRTHSVMNLNYNYYGKPTLGQEVTEHAGEHNHLVKGETEKTGNGQPFDNRPRYYALYYIMKL